MLDWILQSRRLRRVMVIVASLLVAASNVCCLSDYSKKDSRKIENLNLFYPFVFSSKIDPRNVVTVGDSVVSDHLFAYHIATTIEKGIKPHFSDVTFNEAKSLVSFKTVKDLFYSDGKKFSQSTRCESLKSSMDGTQHARYKSLVKKVICHEDRVDVSFVKTPINFRYLLSLPDFSLYDPADLPIVQSSNLQRSTGPYRITSLSKTKVEMALNEYYPAEFRANNIKKATINAFDGSKTSEFVRNASPEIQHLIYSPGYSISKEDLAVLRKRGYRTQWFSTEWLVHIGFQSSISREDRRRIGKVIDKSRTQFFDYLGVGHQAFSIVPDDRAFGVSEQAYYDVLKQQKEPAGNLEKKYKLATLDEWANIPLFKEVLNVLKASLGIEVVLFSRDNMGKVYSDQADMYLSPLGFSPGDPLGHLSYLSKYDPFFRKYVTDDQISSFSVADSHELFTKMIHDLELEFIKERVVIPIAHFPGIIAEAEWLKRDEHLSNNWGVQAWAYRVD